MLENLDGLYELRDMLEEVEDFPSRQAVAASRPASSVFSASPLVSRGTVAGAVLAISIGLALGGVAGFNDVVAWSRGAHTAPRATSGWATAAPAESPTVKRLRSKGTVQRTALEALPSYQADDAGGGTSPDAFPHGLYEVVRS